MSAPPLSAISVMAVAAPGEVPQIAVVPGSTRKYASTAPRMLLTTITETTAARNSGQSCNSVPTMAGVMVAAIMQPTTACPIRNSQCDTPTEPPQTATTRMPPIIGPSSRAAGRPAHSSTVVKTTDSASSTAHCTPSARPRIDHG